MADAYAAAQDYIRQHHPRARAAFLGGSAATGTATPTSDLDVLVLLDDEARDVAYVETTTHRGWLVEAFVYSPDTVDHWLRKGRQERRPVLDSLAATGLTLTQGDEARAWAEVSRAVLAAGPPDVDAAEVDPRRYALSALVDDLEGGAAADEVYVVAATAFREAAELALLVQRRWLGSGKWLVRNLRSADDHGLLAWAAAGGTATELARICRSVLDAAGGYLQVGFIRGDHPRAQPT
ncbi:nucleotidyltransferase domain-containing protein [Thalassiella azotivora]